MNPEKTIVALSYFDWMTVLALAGLTWFLLARHFRSQDKLADAVAFLAKEVGELRSWIAESYVTKPDHVRDLDRLSEDIERWSSRFERDLEAHRDECPVRRG